MFKKDKSRKAEGFSDIFDSDAMRSKPALAGSRSVGAVNAVGAVLTTQEIGDGANAVDQAVDRAVDHGTDLLDALDRIRHDLLFGDVSREGVELLLARISQRTEVLAEPRLQSLLDEIELRARVELAKFGVSHQLA